MFLQDDSADALIWHRRAASLATKLNIHHWLSRLMPKFFILLTAAALCELLDRELGDLPSLAGEMVLLGALLISGWAWLESRRHFCDRGRALVRLETVLGLHNRLSCAEAGVLPWPRISNERPDDGYSPNWTQIVLPILAGMIFLGAAHLIPVHHVRTGVGTGTISEPPDYAQVQNWINSLKAADLIEPAKLQEMQSSLDKLRQRAPQDWYTQSTLEAADALKELMEQSMNSLGTNLDQADQAVEAMRNQEQSASNAASLRSMQDQLSETGDALASGNLPLKREFVEQFKDGTSSDKPLSASQLAALHQRLQQGKAACRTAPMANGGFGEEMQQAIGGAMSHGLARRTMVIGSGGLGGGKESAPLILQSRDRVTPEGALTAVNNDDMSRAALGDTIKITASSPTVDPANYQGSTTAGEAHVNGNGGEAVWRSTYDPQEADILSRFFQ